MGGCIAGRTYAAYAERVSSLYGRVYRSEDMLTPIGGSFLPVWEGVSALSQVRAQVQQFPPCMGGCISLNPMFRLVSNVSSLYGRVYRLQQRLAELFIGFLPIWEGVSGGEYGTAFWGLFPPCMGGCIVHIHNSLLQHSVSSLYGRVYRLLAHYPKAIVCFLPVWEGVSL